MEPSITLIRIRLKAGVNPKFIIGKPVNAYGKKVGEIIEVKLEDGKVFAVAKITDIKKFNEFRKLKKT